MLFVEGTLLYSPLRFNLKNSDQADNLILDIKSPDFATYYQWFLKKQYGECLKLQSPMFGIHVTVIRPQEADLKSPLWLKYQNKKVTIGYSPKNLERHWEFWSLSVFSDKLVEIRKEFNLRTDFRLHITIGRQFDWQPKNIIKNVIHDTDYLNYEPKLNSL